MTSFTLLGVGICEDKVRLTKAWSVSAINYSAAVTELNNRRAVSSGEAYRRLRMSAEDAKRLCDAAKLDLEMHLAEHRC